MKKAFEEFDQTAHAGRVPNRDGSMRIFLDYDSFVQDHSLLYFMVVLALTVESKVGAIAGSSPPPTAGLVGGRAK